MELGLKGKNAIVTGSASGFGETLAYFLSSEGVNVIVTDIQEQAAERVARRCRENGTRAFPIIADLSVAEEAAGLIDRSEELLGPVDILVNNAGLWPTNLVADIPLAEWNKTMAINLTAVFLTCQRFVQNVTKRQGKGKILNITSQAAFNGSTTGHAHYAAAKSGVVTFTISLSREIARQGINVNALALGMVETPMSREALSRSLDEYIKRIQIGRIARPDEVASLAVFLVSDCADYFTGATFDATGGMISR